MFAKIEVNGAGADPLYEFLKSSQPDPEGKTDIPWNFTKFLVDRSGACIERFAPTVAPEDIAEKLAKAL